MFFFMSVPNREKEGLQGHLFRAGERQASTWQTASCKRRSAGSAVYRLSGLSGWDLNFLLHAHTFLN